MYCRIPLNIALQAVPFGTTPSRRFNQCFEVVFLFLCRKMLEMLIKSYSFSCPIWDNNSSPPRNRLINTPVNEIWTVFLKLFLFYSGNPTLTTGQIFLCVTLSPTFQPPIPKNRIIITQLVDKNYPQEIQVEMERVMFWNRTVVLKKILETGLTKI